ncbi:hypothetical protein C4D60_Mb05t30100 [Musa balbisiana]|uniref:Uncharacterized protein n=1 Tax=Musa balbisiana TaxID=52838 RepID=A0A4S8K017_MUSBA|nr:hypothetical protein C4D60_Mb05t30100 [Musa balbisiana]
MNTHVLFSGLEQSSDSCLWTLGLLLKIRTFHSQVILVSGLWVCCSRSQLSMLTSEDVLFFRRNSSLSSLKLHYLPDRLIDPLLVALHLQVEEKAEEVMEDSERVLQVTRDLPLDVTSTWVGVPSRSPLPVAVVLVAAHRSLFARQQKRERMDGWMDGWYS